MEGRDSLKVVVNSALDSVGLQSEVNIPTPPMVDVVLVEDVIQALVQVFQVEQDDCSPYLHADFNLVYVVKHLKKRKTTLNRIQLAARALLP